MVAAWQRRRSPVEQTRPEDEEESQQQEIIDLTDDSIQDSQPPHPAKRRKITHGPNPTTEEETPEKKPRKVGTVESARFQSVSQEGVAQEGKANEIKDSYEEDQELSSAGAVKAKVAIPVPGWFDRDAYSRVVTSSQPSQLSHASQLPQSSQSQNLSSSQLQTPAPRHKYSSLIWDEDIEGVIPDSQEQPGSSSYKLSETQVSKTISTSLETLEVQTTDFGTSGLENTQVTSGGEFSASGTVDSQFAESLENFTQASYVDQRVQSSSVQTEAPSTDRDSGSLEEAVVSTYSSVRLGAGKASSPELRTSSDSLIHLGVTQASQGNYNIEQPSGLLDEIESSHSPSAQLVEDRNSSTNLPTSSKSSFRVPEGVPEESVREKLPTQAKETPSSPPDLQTSQDSLPLLENSSANQVTTPSQHGQAPVSEGKVSSSIEFGTQVPFQRVEDENYHPIQSSPNINSPSVRSSSVPSPYVSALER